MGILEMRDKVMHAPKYDSVGWHYKVDRMPDSQIVALYFKFSAEGLFKKPPRKKSQPEEFRQMTIYDYISTK